MKSHTETTSHLKAERSEASLYALAGAEAVDGTCRDRSACRLSHCGVCRRRHAAGTCAACVHRVLDDVDQVVDMMSRLVAHALVGVGRGTGVPMRGHETRGEALLLAMPYADPNARDQRLAYAAYDDVTYLYDTEEDATPAEWLARWQRRAREDRAGSTVDADLSDLAWCAEHGVGFATLAEEARAWVGRLEALLCEGEEIRRTPVRCQEYECGGRLVWRDGVTERLDGWTCEQCGTWLRADEPAEIARLVIKTSAPENTWTTVPDSALGLGVPESTLRVWMHRGRVAQRKTGTGVVEIEWATAVECAAEREARKAKRAA